jgi:hypothetical protein
MHCVRREASRAAWTAGRRSPTSTPMMAITTNNSTSVKPCLRVMWGTMEKILLGGEGTTQRARAGSGERGGSCRWRTVACWPTHLLPEASNHFPTGPKCWITKSCFAVPKNRVVCRFLRGSGRHRRCLRTKSSPACRGGPDDCQRPDRQNGQRSAHRIGHCRNPLGVYLMHLHPLSC